MEISNPNIHKLQWFQNKVYVEFSNGPDLVIYRKQKHTNDKSFLNTFIVSIFKVF